MDINTFIKNIKEAIEASNNTLENMSFYTPMSLFLSKTKFDFPKEEVIKCIKLNSYILEVITE
ncbi:MAG: hypothetical protein ACRC92_27420 [Peptostreptococcaceae bacterium]